MTWIVDQHGRRWVENPPRKRRTRKSLGRFEHVKVGDQLQQRVVSKWQTFPRDPLAANDIPAIDHERDHGYAYAIVTDLWFDPVRGQDNLLLGQMAAIQPLRQGIPTGRKDGHSVIGLASNGWHYAKHDEIAHWGAVRAGVADGAVLAIRRKRK